MIGIDQIIEVAKKPQKYMDKLYAILLSGNFKDIKAWLELRKKIEAGLNINDCSLELVLAIICTENINSVVEYIASINKDISKDNFLQYLAKRNLELPVLAKGNTVWHWLAKGGHYQCLKQAIELQLFNPNIMFSIGGYAVWHILAIFDHIDELLFAIDDGMFNPETLKDKDGRTVWDLLPKQTMEQLRFDNANTIYHLLAIRGHNKRLLAAINHGKFNHRTLTNRIGAAVWHYLALGGHFDELCLAIEAGYFDPASLVTVSGYTVWHYLAISGHIDKILLAIEQKKIDLIRLKHSSEIDLWSLVPGNAWIDMIRHNRIDELRIMIASGYCKPELVKNDKNRASIWHYYALYGYDDEVLTAIDQNLFDPNTLLDNKNLSIWHYMAHGGYAAKLKLIHTTFPHLFEKLDKKSINACIPEEKSNINTKYMLNQAPAQFANGKNKRSKMVISISKKTQAKKLWIEKPLVNEVYVLENAVCEVFFGQLAVKIFGKDCAPKTKFILEKPGIVSRVLRKEKYSTNDLDHVYDYKYINFSEHAQLMLIRMLCYGVLINDRDLAARNTIVQYLKNTDNIIIVHAYSIDHEQANFEKAGLISFKDFFKLYYGNKSVLTDIVITNSKRWSAVSEVFADANKSETDAFNKRLFNAVSDEQVQQIFKEIATQIAGDEFKICYDTKQEIHKHLTKNGSIYKPYFVDRIIMPQIDQLIAVLKENIRFCIKHMQEPRKVCFKC